MRRGKKDKVLRHLHRSLDASRPLAVDVPPALLAEIAGERVEETEETGETDGLPEGEAVPVEGIGEGETEVKEEIGVGKEEGGPGTDLRKSLKRLNRRVWHLETNPLSMTTIPLPRPPLRTQSGNRRPPHLALT